MCTGEVNLGSWKGETPGEAQAPGPANSGSQSTLVLAAKRTDRPDILRGFKRYRGGWDITNRHYWAVSTCFFSHSGCNLIDLFRCDSYRFIFL